MPAKAKKPSAKSLVAHQRDRSLSPEPKEKQRSASRSRSPTRNRKTASDATTPARVKKTPSASSSSSSASDSDSDSEFDDEGYKMPRPVFPWQRDLIEALSLPTTTSAITWVVDHRGLLGNSSMDWLIQLIMSRIPGGVGCSSFTEAKAVAHLMEMKSACRTYMFDWTHRAALHVDPAMMSVLEKLKAGRPQRYAGMLLKTASHVWVFAKVPPPADYVQKYKLQLMAIDEVTLKFVVFGTALYDKYVLRRDALAIVESVRALKRHKQATEMAKSILKETGEYAGELDDPGLSFASPDVVSATTSASSSTPAKQLDAELKDSKEDAPWVANVTSLMSKIADQSHHALTESKSVAHVAMAKNVSNLVNVVRQKSWPAVGHLCKEVFALLHTPDPTKT